MSDINEIQRLSDTHTMDNQRVFTYNYGSRWLGPIVMQKVTDLPVHSGLEDEGRFLYVISETCVYVGSDTEWLPIGGGGGGWFKA